MNKILLKNWVNKFWLNFYVCNINQSFANKQTILVKILLFSHSGSYRIQKFFLLPNLGGRKYFSLFHGASTLKSISLVLLINYLNLIKESIQKQVNKKKIKDHQNWSEDISLNLWKKRNNRCKFNSRIKGKIRCKIRKQVQRKYKWKK